MVGLKEFCVLLLAGGVGAGSVVTVQKVAKPQVAAARPKPRPKPARAAAPPRPALPDCPATIAPLGVGSLPEFAQSFPQGLPSPLPVPPEAGLRPGIGGGLVLPGGGGGSGGVLLPPPPVGPAVPEPAAWAMMISGFGLVGLALRMGRKPTTLTSPPTHA